LHLLQLTIQLLHPSSPATMSQLSYARYGKDNVRLYKVDKDPKTGIHTVIEQTVRILLQGDIETSYA
jgi:urate oxidase